MRHGIYIFINRQSGTAMDLISDDKLLVGMPPNDSDSQKWEVAPLGAGHTIRNVKTGKYLSVLHATRKEPIITTNFPVAWYMKKIYVVEENAAFFEIWWPNSRFMFEVVDSEHRAPWSRKGPAEGYMQRCRLWRAVCCRLFTSAGETYPDRTIISFSIPMGGAPIRPPPRPSTRPVRKVNETHPNGMVSSANAGNEANISNAHQSGPGTASLVSKLEYESS
ncbi:carbohydrate-binding module family 13 protein [Scleroderma yunnanense]